MKSIIQGWKKLSFNQKATILIQGGILILGVVATLGSVSERHKSERLTEQNKRIAIATVDAIAAGVRGAFVDESYNFEQYFKAMEHLLETADVPAAERNRLLGRTNSVK